MVPMDKKGKQAASDNCAEIDPKKLGSAKEQFDGFSKRIEAQHVEDQVRPSGMKKCGRDNAIEFFAGKDGFGIENVFLLEREALEAEIGYPARQCDDQVSANWH